ncbi:MAG: TonB-dependent siderophore receptor [Pannonibacter phragmitetus]
MALNGLGKSGGLRRAGLLLAATLLTPVAIMTAGAGEARAQAASQQFSFNIAAKPVPQAVNDIGRITGLAVVVRENHAITRAGNPVRGSMTAAEALSRLLQGTGLAYRFSNPGTVQVYDPAAADAGTSATATSGTTLDKIQLQGDTNGATTFVATNVTGATKMDAPLIEVPQSVSVVGRKQMETQNAQSVTEVLRYVPGVAIETYGPDPKGYDWIMMRGFNAQATSSYMDGLRQVSSSYSFFRTDPYQLDSVEVLRGPSSALFGQSDAGGVVNKTSKKPTEEVIRQIAFDYGSHDRKQAQFDLSGPLNEDKTVLYRVIGTARDANTQFKYSDGSKIGDDRLMIAPAITWKPSTDTSLTLSGQVLRDESGGTIMLFTPTNILLGDPNFNQSEQQQQTIGYEFAHRFNDTWSVKQNVRYGHTDFLLDNLFLSGMNSSGVTRIARRFDESFDAFTADNQVLAKFDSGPASHQALMGIDYSWSDADVKRYQGLAPTLNPFTPVYGVSVPVPTAAFINYSERYHQTGLYVQDQIKFGNGFIATLGGRYDWLSMDTHNRLTSTTTKLDVGQFSGRAGLSYVTAFGLVPYVSFSQSFVPNGGVDARGNTFDPSQGNQWEAGIKYQPQGFDGLFTAAYFDITKNNVLNYLANGTAVATGEIQSRGLELEARFNVTRNWDFTASYTYTKAEITKDAASGNVGKRPMLVPEHQASGWLNYTFTSGVLEGASLGAGIRHVGDVFGNNANTFSVPSRTLFDAGASYRVNEHAKLQINATNLFDKKYYTTCDASYSCYQGDRRTVMGRLTLDF